MIPFGLAGASGGMVGRCMPKYGHGGTPGNPFMTIFGVYFSTPIPNIEKFQIYAGLYTIGGRQISRRMAPELCLGIHFRPQL